MAGSPTTLRQLFAGPRIIRIIGAHNALGARLAERAGFDGVWASGLEISTSYCVPDANILTMSEFLEASEAMSDAVSIPVVSDCDTGFGNSNNVIHMVHKFESAGVAAVCIEDKHFPKVNSFIPGRQELAPIAEFVGKIMAARNARRSPDFMVIARVEALIAGWDMEEALTRARAYATAGADAILIHSKISSPEEVLEFASRWDSPVPLIAVPTTYDRVTAAELEEAGFKMVIYANQGLRASIAAMQDVFAEIIASDSTHPVESRIAPMSTVFELQGMPQMKRDEETYLRTGEQKTRAVIPAAGDHLDEYSMKHIAADIPMTMLDINGKPILARQVEVLRQAGISDVTVVGGYKHEKIHVEGAELVVNPDWRDTGIACSFLCADHHYGGRTLMAFSDVLFDRDLLEKLLRTEHDITLVVGRGLGSLDSYRDRALDLVSLADPPAPTRRALETRDDNPIVAIGKGLSAYEAHCEFVGLALFSEKGFKLFREVYESILDERPREAFQEASDAWRASLTDVIQEIIDRGHSVCALQATSGWSEIHSFDDYRDACMLFARK